MRRNFNFRARNFEFELGPRTLLMGILNVTPDSFSDGGRFLEASAAIEQGLYLWETGADIIDIGGESSRPGSSPVSEEEELKRILPVLEQLVSRVRVPVSIDTYKSEVARICLEAGASIINDISSLRFDPNLAEVVRRFDAGIVLMHMRGEPASMHLLNESDDILSEVSDDLQKAVQTAESSGISRDKIMIDPGLGFGKNTNENLRILNRLSFLEDLDLPILIGPSRKRFIGHVLNRSESDRLLGTGAACAAALIRGAHVLRVHDIEEIKQVSLMIDAIEIESMN